MKEVKFFKCSECGRIECVVDGEEKDLNCCGRIMEELKTNNVDAAVEKHVPIYEINKDSISVKVGEVEHPMTEEHYIMWMTTLKEIFMRRINSKMDKMELLEVNEMKHKEKPELREAHKALAREVITDLHGKESYEEAVKISESLFSGDIKNFTAKDIEVAFKGLTPFEINEDLNIIDLLVNSGVCSSKREAREFVSNNSITINGKKLMI